jgi:hopanoid biosynthesis associated RND transporter like protein HpnN
VIGFLARLVDFCRRSAWAVLIVTALLTALSGVYAANSLGINTDTSKLFSPALEWQKQKIAFQQAFPEGVNQTTIVVDGKSADAVEDGTAALAAALAQRTDMFRSVHRPDGGEFFNRYGLMFLSTSELGQLSDQIAAAQPLLGPLDADPSLRGLFGVFDQAFGGIEGGEASGDQLRAPMDVLAKATLSVVDGHPQSVDWGQLMTGQPPRAEQLRHFIQVQSKLDYEALEPGAAASQAIRDTAASLHLAEQGVQVRLTGDVPLEDDEFASVAQGAGTTTGLSLLFVVIILLVGFRAPRMIAAIVVTLLVGLVLTAAFAAASVGTLNMISITFAVLFIGIGVDFGIQFSMRYRAELFAVAMGTTPEERRAANGSALARTAHGVCGPLAIAAVATAVGFYSFVPTDYQGVSELGLIAGTSMIVALLTNLTVLPALLAVLPARGRPEAAGFAWAAPVDRWLQRHARAVLIVAVVFAVAAAAGIPAVSFDADPLDLKDPTKESVKTALELTHDPLATPYSIDVLMKNLGDAEGLAGTLEKVPEVRLVLSLASFVPEDQPAKLDILSQMQLFLGPILDEGNKVKPPTPEEEHAAVEKFSQHLAAFLARPAGAELGDPGRHLSEALIKFLAMPDGRDVGILRTALLRGLQGRLDMLAKSIEAGPLTVETMPPEIKSDWITPDGRARLAVFPKGDMHDHAQLSQFIGAVRKLTPNATGGPVLIFETGRTVSGAFLTASISAFVAITIVLAVILRRFRDVVLVVVPLGMAGLYTLGTTVLIGLHFNYANVIAIPLLMGIGVAFDIYFVMLWRSGGGPVALLQTPTARAVVFSAATTTTAFGSLALSHHVGTASMGVLLIIALGYVLLSTLFVQPALMIVLGRNEVRRR